MGKQNCEKQHGRSADERSQALIEFAESPETAILALQGAIGLLDFHHEFRRKPLEIAVGHLKELAGRADRNVMDGCGHDGWFFMGLTTVAGRGLIFLLEIGLNFFHCEMIGSL